MTTPPTPFELWLETEAGDPDQPANRPRENFCNITVATDDGRRYALNVWTFDFLPLARYPWPHDPHQGAPPARYVLPPDLFVESLDREVIEGVVAELLGSGQMRDAWLTMDEEE